MNVTRLVAAIRTGDVEWIPKYAKGTALDAASGLGTRQQNVVNWLRDQGACSKT